MEDYKKETINSYNLNIKEFSSRFEKELDLKNRPELNKFIKLIPGKEILDLGCGSGDCAIYFKKQGLTVKGIDISEEMVNLCKEKGLNVEVMDIEELDFKDKKFDGIWAATSLLHVPKSNLPKVVDKISQILKDEGIIYLSVKEGLGERFIQDKNDKTKRFFSFFKENEILNLFKDKFSLIESSKVLVEKTTFLQFFFRKI